MAWLCCKDNIAFVIFQDPTLYALGIIDLIHLLYLFTIYLFFPFTTLIAITSMNTDDTATFRTSPSYPFFDYEFF